MGRLPRSSPAAVRRWRWILRIAAGEDVAGEALAWARPLLASGPVLLYSTAAPDSVRQTQGALGAERAGALIEAEIARIARGLIELGVRQLIVAGGETSGAVVQALGLEQIAIGEQIDPACPGVRAARRGRCRHQHRAEVWQFRRRGFLPEGVRARLMPAMLATARPRV